jgi:hypothetical protein
MALSTKSAMAETAVKLGDLFTKVSELSKLEDNKLGKIVSTIVPVLSWLNTPIVLHPESLGETFRDIREASLLTGAVVLMTDERGRGYSRTLAKFSVEDCLAILQDCFPELQRLVADKKRAGHIKPALSVKMILGGSKLLIDMRSYRLVISNSGGDCTDVRVSGSFSGGKKKTLGPVAVDKGHQAEVDLGVFKEVHNLDHLDLVIECKDADGRALKAEEPVRLDWEEWQPAEWQPGSLRKA